MEKIDYSEYRLHGRERILFFTVGYTAFFITGMLFYRSYLLSLITGLLILAYRRPFEKKIIKRRKDRLLLQFKDLLYSLSASVATGRSLHEGFIDAEKDLKGMYSDDDYIIIELKTIINGLTNRENEKELLTDLARRSRLKDISGFTDVYLTVRDSGGDMQKVITRTCDVLMDRITIEKEIEKVVSQKKTEAMIITSIPILILAGLNLMSPGYISPMYTTLAGRMIMTSCLCIIVIAYILTERITDIRV